MANVEKRLGYLGDRARLLRDAFALNDVDYMFIGKGSAIAQGFMGTTQDLDVYPLKAPENCSRLATALKSIGFPLKEQRGDRTVDLAQEILKGSDFVQLLDPFDLDLVFAPDGFEDFKEAIAYRVVIDGYPLLSIDGIIRSKKAAGRARDRADLPLLEQFKDYTDGKAD